MSQPSFVESTISTWLNLQLALSHLPIASAVSRLPDGSKAVIEIETSTHLALVEIWEYGLCLDTTIHATNEEKGSILASGPCKSQGEVAERLNALLAALLPKTSA